MSQFKAGDVVVCVDNGNDFTEKLVVGKDYTVKSWREDSDYNCNFIQLEELAISNFHYKFDADRFILKQTKDEDGFLRYVQHDLLPLIQHYTANNQNLLFSVEDGKLVVTNIEKDQRCVVESLEEAVEALKLLDNISKSAQEWDEFYKEKEHV